MNDSVKYIKEFVKNNHIPDHHWKFIFKGKNYAMSFDELIDYALNDDSVIQSSIYKMFNGFSYYNSGMDVFLERMAAEAIIRKNNIRR